MGTEFVDGLQEELLIPSWIDAFQWKRLGFHIIQLQHQERVMLFTATTLLLMLLLVTSSRYVTAFDWSMEEARVGKKKKNKSSG